MKIQYWCFPFNAEDKKQTPREQDGRVLKKKPLVDFMYESIYGIPRAENSEVKAERFVQLAVYDVLATAGILTIEELKDILRMAYSIGHPDDHHPRTFDIIEGYCK